jgi:transcriptional regulator with XRE-family HTH domain
MTAMDTVGKRLQYMRTNRDLTLEALSERAGVSKSFLWEVEHDRVGISGEKLLRVANVLSASLDFLLRGDPVPQDYHAPSIEIPRELSELAEETGLSYKKTLALLEIDRSILARRSTKSRQRKSKDDWRKLYNGVKEFMEEQ